jgi:hypothetical protein
MSKKLNHKPFFPPRRAVKRGAPPIIKPRRPGPRRIAASTPTLVPEVAASIAAGPAVLEKMFYRLDGRQNERLFDELRSRGVL